MTTNFNYPSASELFSQGPTVTGSSNPSRSIGIIIGLIIIAGGFAVFGICQYQMRKQLIDKITAEQEKTRQKNVG